MKAIDPHPAAGFVGKWRNIEGEIEITQGANGKLAVAVNSWMPYYGNWVCDLEEGGNAVVDGDSLKVTYQDLALGRDADAARRPCWWRASGAAAGARRRLGSAFLRPQWRRGRRWFAARSRPARLTGD